MRRSLEGVHEALQCTRDGCSADLLDMHARVMGELEASLGRWGQQLESTRSELKLGIQEEIERVLGHGLANRVEGLEVELRMVRNDVRSLQSVRAPTLDDLRTRIANMGGDGSPHEPVVATAVGDGGACWHDTHRALDDLWRRIGNIGGDGSPHEPVVGSAVGDGGACWHEAQRALQLLLSDTEAELRAAIGATSSPAERELATVSGAEARLVRQLLDAKTDRGASHNSAAVVVRARCDALAADFLSWRCSLSFALSRDTWQRIGVRLDELDTEFVRARHEHQQLNEKFTSFEVDAREKFQDLVNGHQVLKGQLVPLCGVAERVTISEERHKEITQTLGGEVGRILAKQDTYDTLLERWQSVDSRVAAMEASGHTCLQQFESRLAAVEEKMQCPDAGHEALQGLTGSLLGVAEQSKRLETRVVAVEGVVESFTSRIGAHEALEGQLAEQITVGVRQNHDKWQSLDLRVAAMEASEKSGIQRLDDRLIAVEVGRLATFEKVLESLKDHVRELPAFGERLALIEEESSRLKVQVAAMKECLPGQAQMTDITEITDSSSRLALVEEECLRFKAQLAERRLSQLGIFDVGAALEVKLGEPSATPDEACRQYTNRLNAIESQCAGLHSQMRKASVIAQRLSYLEGDEEMHNAQLDHRIVSLAESVAVVERRNHDQWHSLDSRVAAIETSENSGVQGLRKEVQKVHEQVSTFQELGQRCDQLGEEMKRIWRRLTQITTNMLRLRACGRAILLEGGPSSSSSSTPTGELCGASHSTTASSAIAGVCGGIVEATVKSLSCKALAGTGAVAAAAARQQRTSSCEKNADIIAPSTPCPGSRPYPGRSTASAP